MVCTFFKDGLGVYVRALLQAFFKTLRRVFVGQLEKSHTSLVALLFDLVARENGSDNRLGIVPYT
jgi:hypothetical protein